MTAPSLESMKFYIIVPEEGTNLITNPLPAFAGDTGYGVNGAGATKALSDTYTRRGPQSLAMTPAADTACNLYFGTVALVDNETYTFSVDVLCESGEPLSISIRTTGGVAEATETFTSTGYWQRKSVTWTCDSTTNYRVYVSRLATSSNTFSVYTDGWQVEENDEATTFITGYTRGFDAIGSNREYYWNGTPNASTSTRSALTRHGGRLLDISDYATVQQALGLGMGNFKQVYTELVSGGAYYQKHVRKPRNFSLLLTYDGLTAGELHDNRKTIIDAIRPDYTGYDQPLVIRYQGFDSSVDEATHPLDIVCIPQPCHADPPDNSRLQMQELLSFTVLDSHLSGAFFEGNDLTVYEEISADYVARRDRNGQWHGVFDSNSQGLSDIVRCFAEAPNGDIYMGGWFATAGGDATAAYLCKWDGTDMISVTGAADFNAYVEALAFDAEGNLYIGGSFENAGDANGDGIVMWDGSTLHSLGTGLEDLYGGGGAAFAIAIDPNTGYVYVGGSFREAGGVADTECIAMWDGTSWNALGDGLASSPSSVDALVFGPDGYLYVGGNFEGADYPNGDYIVQWDGTSYNALPGGELNGFVYNIRFDNRGDMVVCGRFTQAGSNSACNYIAKYRYGSWYGLQGGADGSYVYDVSIEEDNSLYAVGAFDSIGFISISDGIAHYKNGSWQPVDLLLPVGSGITRSYIANNGDLWIGGDFTTADGVVTTNKIALNVSNSTGSANTYPYMKIEGPGTLQSLINYTTGRSITFDGLTLQTGEWIQFEFDPVRLRFNSNWRGNILRYVNPGSDYGDFFLAPGTNYISVFMPDAKTLGPEGWIWYSPKFWSIEGARYK